MIRRVNTLQTVGKRTRSRSGQALLESFGIIMLLCLILFGLVQYILMLTATEVIQYSADASVRARAVGFNSFMVRKVALVTSIPNAGRMTTPGGFLAGDANAWNSQSAGNAFTNAVSSNPSSSQYWQVERWNIPLFLGSPNTGIMYGYLDYEEWDTVGYPQYTLSSGDMVGVSIRQEFPLRMPLFRAFSDDDEIRIRQEAELADHAELYLE